MKNNKELKEKIQNVFGDTEIYNSSKQEYIQIALFYKFLSYKVEKAVNEFQKINLINKSYEELWNDDNFSEEVEQFLIEKLGYLIEPEDLFDQFLQAAKQSSNLELLMFEKALIKLEESSLDFNKSQLFNKIFSHVDFSNRVLGRRMKERNKIFNDIVIDLERIDIETFDEDDFAVAYYFISEIMGSSYRYKDAQSPVPYSMLSLIEKLLLTFNIEIKEIYDPNLNEGTLISRTAKSLGVSAVYGQEWLRKRYNLARINAIINDINDIHFRKTELLELDSDKDKKYQCIINSFPDFGKQEYEKEYFEKSVFLKLSNFDLRDKVKEEFIDHIFDKLDEDGVAILIIPKNMLNGFRSNEGVIKRLIKDKLIDAIIELPDELFRRESSRKNIIILRNRQDKTIDYPVQFIDASKEFIASEYFARLDETHVEKIVNAFKERKSIPGYSEVVDYTIINQMQDSLKVSSYVKEVYDKRKINKDILKIELNKIEQRIKELNQSINQTLLNNDYTN